MKQDTDGPTRAKQAAAFVKGHPKKRVVKHPPLHSVGETPLKVNDNNKKKNIKAEKADTAFWTCKIPFQNVQPVNSVTGAKNKDVSAWETDRLFPYFGEKNPNPVTGLVT